MTPGPSPVFCGAVSSVMFGAIVGSVGTFHLNDGISTVRTCELCVLALFASYPGMTILAGVVSLKFMT
jgi:hypothetical protein